MEAGIVRETETGSPVPPVTSGITEIPSLGLSLHLSKEEPPGMALPALTLMILVPVLRMCPGKNTVRPYLRKDSI